MREFLHAVLCDHRKILVITFCGLAEHLATSRGGGHHAMMSGLALNVGGVKSTIYNRKSGYLGAPAGIRTPNQQIMRPVEGY